MDFWEAVVDHHGLPRDWSQPAPMIDYLKARKGSDTFVVAPLTECVSEMLVHLGMTRKYPSLNADVKTYFSEYRKGASTRSMNHVLAFMSPRFCPMETQSSSGRLSEVIENVCEANGVAYNKCGEDSYNCSSCLTVMKMVMTRFGGMRREHHVEASGRHIQDYILDQKTYHCPLKAWRVFLVDHPSFAMHVGTTGVGMHCVSCAKDCTHGDQDRWVLCCNLSCLSRHHLRCVGLDKFPSSPWMCECCRSHSFGASRDESRFRMQSRDECDVTSRSPNLAAEWSAMQNFGWSTHVTREGLAVYRDILGKEYESLQDAKVGYRNCVAHRVAEEGWKLVNGMWCHPNSSRTFDDIAELVNFVGVTTSELYPLDGPEAAMGPTMDGGEEEVGEPVAEGAVALVKEQLGLLVAEYGDAVSEVQTRLLSSDSMLERGIMRLGASELVRFVKRQVAQMTGAGVAGKMMCLGFTQSEKNIFIALKGVINDALGRLTVVVTSTNNNRDEICEDKIKPRYEEWGFSEDDLEYVHCATFEEIKAVPIGKLMRMKGVISMTATHHQIDW